LRCKHSAAVLMMVTKELEMLLRLPESPTAVAAAPMLDFATQMWLQQLQAAAAAHQQASQPAAPHNKFLIYGISKSLHAHTTVPTMGLYMGTQNKNSITIDHSRPTADIYKPAKYMAAADLELVSQFRRIERRQGNYSVQMRGVGWHELLQGILATGRLYLIELGNHRSRIEFSQLAAGPPETVTATWQTTPKGGSRPVLEFTGPTLQLLPTEPPYYIDFTHSLIGPVESDFPANVLTAWERGPTIAASNIPLLSGQLAKISAQPLPTPFPLDQEVRPATAPMPVLSICRKVISPDFNGSQTIVGLPRFRYGDSPALPPLAPKENPRFTQVAAGSCISWPRDAVAEAQQLKVLSQAGFIPLAAVTSAHFLTATTRDAVTLKESFRESALGWIDFLESPAAEALRAAGWSLEVDPKAGLTAHDAGDFFSAIDADPDHGIDWFRFDMQFELDGKKLSLIPIIARLIEEGYPPADSPELPESIAIPCKDPADGFFRFPARRLLEIVEQVCHLFHGKDVGEGGLRLDRLAAAGVADALAIDTSKTTRALAQLGRNLKSITSLPLVEVPASVRAELRPYQLDGYRWLQFLAHHHLNGILADDMGLGKTIQTLAHLAAECVKNPGKPSLVIAPTSVVPNWASEAEKFTPHLRVVTLQGKDRAASFMEIAAADIVLTSYPLLTRDSAIFREQDWHVLVLDEAQYIKNPKAIVAQQACKLRAAHRLCLSGTPMENHLGELWSLMRFLMPGFLGDEKSFNLQLRKPIERDHSPDAQLALNRRVAALILRRTKDQVATDLPAKTLLIHHVELTKKQTDLYESVRATMDQRVRDAIAAKGLAQSQIIVLDALLKLRQICCHPQLLKSPAAQKIHESAKLDYLTTELLPTLLEEGRRILLFSQFTSMLALIEAHLLEQKIPYLILTGKTKDRASLVKKFQSGEIPIFLISLKAGGTGLNLTAADTIIHYDPWWNPAAENQATDRAHRIGQTKPVFVHKLVCRGTIEDRILELQQQKAALVEALLSSETTKLKIDAETLSQLLSPLD
jgi:SNF2-related domain/Helicase conserved C-terminal domain